ncbi:unnamed protein product [Caenorhabditis auriculariae]|uniref:Uncharacterized protein n=1 Tax=Caenorhabditis auriculariae TaxID=2777116 RepID=A0A8S1HIT3_9PELO|nr:unnamed protein product [Caenorhabditis auriculariae]
MFGEVVAVGKPSLHSQVTKAVNVTTEVIGMCAKPSITEDMYTSATIFALSLTIVAALVVIFVFPWKSVKDPWLLRQITSHVIMIFNFNVYMCMAFRPVFYFPSHAFRSLGIFKHFNILEKLACLPAVGFLALPIINEVMITTFEEKFRVVTFSRSNGNLKKNYLRCYVMIAYIIATVVQLLFYGEFSTPERMKQVGIEEIGCNMTGQIPKDVIFLNNQRGFYFWFSVFYISYQNFVPLWLLYRASRIVQNLGTEHRFILRRNIGHLVIFNIQILLHTIFWAAPITIMTFILLVGPYSPDTMYVATTLIMLHGPVSILYLAVGIVYPKARYYFIIRDNLLNVRGEELTEEDLQEYLDEYLAMGRLPETLPPSYEEAIVATANDPAP